MGKVTASLIQNQLDRQPEASDKNDAASSPDKGKSVKDDKEEDNKEDSKEEKTILIGENNDILTRYRIPVDNNVIDYSLQLPEDSDSSVFSNEGAANND